MQDIKVLDFTFIFNFRGGTYCTQVQATDINESIRVWINKIAEEQDQIEYLDKEVIEELKNEFQEEDNLPVLLTGLRNIWHTLYSTKQGLFDINIVQTDINNLQPT